MGMKLLGLCGYSLLFSPSTRIVKSNHMTIGTDYWSVITHDEGLGVLDDG